MKDTISELQQRAKVRGFDVRLCAAEHLNDLREEITSRLASEEIDRRFAEERLADFDFSPALDGAPPAAVIITAAPQPQQLAIFHYRGKEYRYPVPPTYADDTDTAVTALLTGWLKPRGFTLAPTRLPLKLLAVRTGLARYGRNNISYHARFGSYFKLRAFVTDLPAAPDHWTEETWLPECANCLSCVKACPTGVITPERAIIRAERCLTYFNEDLADFPDWINPKWHTCLIGCLRCQIACPADRDIDIEPKEPVRFSEAETSNLLNAREENEVTAAVRERLATLSFPDDRDIIVRNLQMLMNVNQSS